MIWKYSKMLQDAIADRVHTVVYIVWVELYCCGREEAYSMRERQIERDTVYMSYIREIVDKRGLFEYGR
jgi:hypothetical protein